MTNLGTGARTHARSLTLALALALAGSLSACDDPPEPRDGESADLDASAPDAGALTADDASVVALDAAPTPDAYSSPAPETGRMAGMTAAHNRFRAMADTSTPIPPLVWDPALAAVAQAYSERLASGSCNLVHSSSGYGENLYWQRGRSPSAADVVASWHEEIDCYTYGTFMRADACDAACVAAMNASGCGHYTQVVWRNTQRLGCGMATCASGAEIWTCNYDPPGNYIGQYPY